MDNFEFGMFGECDDYNAREEFAREQETDEEFLDDLRDDYATDYYGEEEFA